MKQIKAAGRGLRGFGVDAYTANKDNYLGLTLLVLYLGAVAGFLIFG